MMNIKLSCAQDCLGCCARTPSSTVVHFKCVCALSLSNLRLWFWVSHTPPTQLRSPCNRRCHVKRNPPVPMLPFEDIDNFQFPPTIHRFDTRTNGSIPTNFNMSSWIGFDMKGICGFKDLIPTVENRFPTFTGRTSWMNTTAIILCRPDLGHQVYRLRGKGFVELDLCSSHAKLGSRLGVFNGGQQFLIGNLGRCELSFHQG